MTLERQTISLPIGVSMSQAEAAPYLQGNAESSNVRFDKRGLASKRRPAAEVAQASAVGLGNNVLDVSGMLHINGVGGSMRFDAQETSFARQNTTEPRTSSERVTPILRGRLIAANPSIAVLGNVACVVWTDEQTPLFVPREGQSFDVATAEVWAAFYDISGDRIRILSGPAPVSGYVRSAHVVALDTGGADACFIMIGESSASAMRWDRYVLTAGTYTFSGGAAFATGRISNGIAYDVCAPERGAGYGGTYRAYACWATAAGTQLYSVNAAGTVTGYTVTTVGRADGCAIHLNLVSDTLYIAQRDGVYWGMNPSLSGATAGYSGTCALPLPDLTVLRVCVGHADGSGGVLLGFSGRYLFGYDGTTTPTIWGSAFFKENTGSAHTFVPNTAIIGKPIFYGAAGLDYRTLIPVQGFASRRGFLVSLDDLGTALTDEWTSAPHAAFSSTLFCEANVLEPSTEIINGPISNWTVPLVSDSDGDLHIVYPVALGIDINNPTFPTQRITTIQLDHARIRTAQHAPCRATKASDLTIHASGSGAVCADTQLTTELTPQRPDRPWNTGKAGDAISAIVNTNNTLTFYLSVIWGWFDMQGREHRSAESDQLGTILTGGIGVNSGADWIPFLFACPIPMPLALYGNEARSYYVDVIQSTGDDADDRRVIARLWNPNIDSDFPDSIVFQLAQATTTSALYPRSLGYFVRDFSATTIAYPEPYTTTELEAVAPGGLVDIVSTQSRLWALSSEARFSVLTTKPITPTVAPEFADELSIDVPQEGGDCVGLAALDDKLIVFKQSRIYIIVGDPGDASGNRSSVQRPRLLSSDVGATNAAGIVEGPFGVAFQSLRGPMLLTRGLELQPIGERVKDTAAGYSAVGSLVADQQEVRWYLFTDDDGERWTSTGSAVVWQYERSEWAVWTDVSVQSESANGSTISQLWPSTSLYQETTAPDWTLAGYNNGVTTPWISLGNVEGYVRIWRATMLGYWYTGHVNVFVSYDYDDTIAETHTFLESVCETLDAANGRIELSIRPDKQKCSAIRLQIQGQAVSGQDPPYPTVGEGLSIVSVDLEIGTKSGTARRRLAAEAKR